MQVLFRALLQELAKGNNAVLLSVIASSGSTPRGKGAKMLVMEDGRTFGTIGGGGVELAAVGLAKEAHAGRASRIAGYDLCANAKADLGMICGGKATVYFQFIPAGDAAILEMLQSILVIMENETDAWLVTAIREGAFWQMGVWSGGALLFARDIPREMVEPHLCAQSVLTTDEPQLYIEPLVQSGRVYVFGGGHVAQALVPVIAGVGFRPVVFDDRERFTDIALFPGAVKTVRGDFGRIGARFTIKPEDYVVIVTRGHEADYVVLREVLTTPAAYIGMIGSRAKIAKTHERLRADGFQDADFARIHNPIGLPILAETPAEIAISITAELIEHRAKRRAGFMKA